MTSSSPCAFSISVIYSAIAGDALSPGDSMPAAFIKCSQVEFIMKSPVFPTALNPQKEVIVSLKFIPVVVSVQRLSTVDSPSMVVAVSLLFSISSAVGPSRRLPSTVGVTRIPFPISDGVLKMVCETSPPLVLSSNTYSPRLGCSLISDGPGIAATASEFIPAAFTTYAAFTLSPFAETIS